MMEDQIKHKIIELGCFKQGNFILKSGRFSNYYMDLRPLISYPNLMSGISSLIYNYINMFNNIRVCGLPYAGMPYANTLSILHNIPLLILRKEPKLYGTKNMIEGLYKYGDELVIVDDILTTGSSIIESLEHFNAFKIKKVIVLVDRMEGGRAKLKELGLDVVSIFTIEDFIV